MAPASTHGLIEYIETHPTTCNNLGYDKVTITDRLGGEEKDFLVNGVENAFKIFVGNY